MTTARIIKRWTHLADAYDLVPRPSRHDQEQAVSLIRDAHQRAAGIIAAAEARAAAIVREAEEAQAAQWEEINHRALEQARTEARGEVARDMDRAQAAFRAMVERALTAEADLRRAAQAEMLALAVAIAERILGREVRQDPALVEQIATAALSATQGAPLTQIMVHPDDLPVLEPWIASALGDGVAVEIAADPAVGRGGCVIGTKTGFIDARIETQLEEVRHALAEVIEDD